NVPANVTFAGMDLPAFARLQGALLTLAPTRSDQGQFDVTISASDGAHTDSTSLRIVVHRTNRAPIWTYPVTTYDFADDLGPHHRMICPGPHCTAIGTAKLTPRICDPDGDPVNVEVEVVRKGQSFSGQATHRVTVSAKPLPNGTAISCEASEIAFDNLTTEQSYEYALRISDQLGARAALGPGKDADGWLHYPGQSQFDQGPCSSHQCACIPTGQPFERVEQCCTRAADVCTGWFP